MTIDSPRIISRDEARALGLKRYFTGKPCKHGHVAERHVASRKCRECHRERTRRYRAADPERAREPGKGPGVSAQVVGREQGQDQSRPARSGMCLAAAATSAAH